MSERKNPKPDRPADREEHGSGKAPPNVQARAEHAYYAELFIDGLGDWWHLKLWERP